MADLPVKRGSEQVLSERCRLTPVGIAVQGEWSREDWDAVGESLATLQSASRWGIGDWANHGHERRYGQFTRLASMLDMDEKTISNYARAARTFPLDQRRPNLNISHHIEVMYLNADQRNALLDRAENEEVSSILVRQWARALENPVRARLQAGGPGRPGTVPSAVEPQGSGSRQPQQLDKVAWLRQTREAQAIESQRATIVEQAKRNLAEPDARSNTDATPDVLASLTPARSADGVEPDEVVSTVSGSALLDWLDAIPAIPRLPAELPKLSLKQAVKAKAVIAISVALVKGTDPKWEG